MKLAATWGSLPLLGAAGSIVLGIAVPDDVAGAVGVGCEEVYAVVFDGADSARLSVRFSVMHQDAPKGQVEPGGSDAIGELCFGLALLCGGECDVVDASRRCSGGVYFDDVGRRE